ncbi:hypothetical protein [Collimonas silvisoli]|nr:hypothetical protein [Collimonas silvisoli]
MTPQITALQPEALPALQTLWDRQLTPHTQSLLAHDLNGWKNY